MNLSPRSHTDRSFRVNMVRYRGFIRLLKYLRECGCITSQEFLDLMHETVVHDLELEKKSLQLSNLIVLFAGVDWAGDFIFSLPLNLKETTGSADLYSTHLIATDFAWSLGWNVPVTEGWKSIESISFKIAARQGSTLSWTFPFGNSSSQASTKYQLTHDRAIETSIKWPAYSQRSVQGGYRGILHVGEDSEHNLKLHVVGEFSMAYEEAPQYSMTFSNDSYKVEGTIYPIPFALYLFNASNFPFLELLRKINIPALNDELEKLEGKGKESDLPLNNVGFVLEKTSSNVFLKEVSGTLPLTMKLSDWLIFKKTSFSIDSLRVVLKDVDFLIFRKLIIQLSGKINGNGFKSAVPFRLSASLSEGSMAFEITIFPDDNGELSIQQILDVTDMPSILDVSKTFPSVSNISNNVCISNASLGWRKKEINFVRLGIDIEKWDIASGQFVITDLSFNIYATFPKTSKRFSLWGSGAIRISDVDLEVFFDIEQDRVAFQLVMLESPLTLKSVFAHFLGESDTLFPQGFISVLEQTGIESVIVEGSHDDHDGWSLSRLAIATSISTRLDISDKFSLSYPRLVVDVAYPFTETKRTIDAAIRANMELEKLPCDALVSWAGGTSSLTVAFEPREPLSLETLISLFIPGGTTLSVPSSLSFLIGIRLANAKLTLSWSNGKFILSEISATIVSSTSLQLWSGLQLKDLTLYFDYSREEKHTSVTFGASLSFDYATKLDFILSYHHEGLTVSSSGLASQPPPDDNVITTSNNEKWGATVTYDGTISVVNIMSGVSGVDIGNELSSVGLSALREVIDINMSDLRLTLTRNSDETLFTFDANVNHLFFDGPVHLTCSKSTSWLYSFTFYLSANSFLSSFGIDNDWISLTNSTITLSNKPVTGPLLVNTTTGGLNVTFMGTLVFVKSLQKLERVIGRESLTISGSVSNSYFTLAASTDLISFNGMTLTGKLVFSSSINPKKLVAAVEGLVSNIYFPGISTEKFSTTFSLFVKLPFPELGFKFTVDKLENAFGIKDLQFKNILFSAAFQEFPVPSEVAVTGEASFHVDNQEFYGRVEIYFTEGDVLHCGTMGKFETFPSVNQALKGFDSAGRTAPKAVDGTFVDLTFSRALQDVPVGNFTIPQGFTLKGSLKLPSIKCDIKDAIAVTVDNNRLFALTRASDSNRGPSLDLTIDTHSPPYCHFSGEIHLLGLSSAVTFDLSETGLEFHETISSWLAGVKIDFTIDEMYLNLSASCILDLSLPPFDVGIVYIPHIEIVKFAASLATNFYLEGVIWELMVTGDMTLVEWDLGTAGPFTLNAALSDFTKITQYLEKQICDCFAVAFKNLIERGLEELNKLVKDLKAIGLVAAKIIELLVKEFDRDFVEVIREVAEVFRLAKEEVMMIMKDLEATVQEIGRVLKDVFDLAAQDVAQVLKEIRYGVDDIARALEDKDVFNLAIQDVAKILNDVGYDIDDIAGTLHDVFDLTPKDIAPILKDIGYGIDDIAGILKDSAMFDLVTADVAQILKDIGYGIDDIAGKLQDSAFDLATSQDVAQVLKNTGHTIDDIARTLGDVFNLADQNVAQILNDIEYDIDDIARTLSDVFNLATKDVTQILKNIGYGIDDIAGMLKKDSVFDVATEGVAQILKDIGYGIDDIAGILKDPSVFGLATQDVAKILKDTGHTIDDITRILRDVFNLVDQDVAKILKDTGHTIDDITRILMDVFNLVDQDVAQILKDIGYIIDDVTKVLKDVFHLLDEEILYILHDVEYAVDEVDRVIRDIFGKMSDSFGNLFR